MNAAPLLALALDTAKLDDAESMAVELADVFDVAKVGLQLFSGYGPEAVQRVRATGLDVFLDVKLHDIPNTVRGAAEHIGRLGARYVTVHADGGEAMMRAAVEGLADGADQAGLPAPMVLAITVLTSLRSDPGELERRATVAAAGGAGGVVCAVDDLELIRAAAPGLMAVTPGIRLPGSDAGDQQRIATPARAVELGASMLVIGRTVTGAADRKAAAAQVRAEIHRQ